MTRRSKYSIDVQYSLYVYEYSMYCIHVRHARSMELWTMERCMDCGPTMTYIRTIILRCVFHFSFTIFRAWNLRAGLATRIFQSVPCSSDPDHESCGCRSPNISAPSAQLRAAGYFSKHELSKCALSWQQLGERGFG
jgi:hypothetical protein